MAFNDIQAEGITSNQGRIKSYWIDINFSIKDLGLDFSWYLAKQPRAMLDNFNEVVRENSYRFVEDNKLKVETSEWDLVDVSWAALYGSIMDIIIESVNDIKERDDALFVVKVSDTQLRKARRNRKNKLKEIEELKKETAMLDIEKEKQKVINETKRDMIEKMWQVAMIEPTRTTTISTVPNTKQSIPEKSRKKSNRQPTTMDVSKLRAIMVTIMWYSSFVY